MWISVTGLTAKGLAIGFWMHAIPCSMQAKKSKGLLHMETHKVNGVQHTFTAWENRDAMEGFLHSGAHAKAMAAFHDVASEGRTIGFESDTIPTFQEALEVWKTQAVKY